MSAPANQGYRRFEYADGYSNKYWEIKRTANGYMTRFGRIGNRPQESIKLAGAGGYDSIIRIKVLKGYVEATFVA